MPLRARFAFAVLASLAFTACPSGSASKSKPSADAMVAMPPASACDMCVAPKCSKQQLACDTDEPCKSIVACVQASSPCVGARAGNPLCDDDCVKMACALKYPDGVSHYALLQQCQSEVQCGACDMACAKEDGNMKCVANEACNYAAPTPDSCKCSPLDGGMDASVKPPSGAGGSDGGCSAKPDCAVVSASVVNLALGKDIVGPTMTSHTTSGQTLNLCHYDTPQGSSDVDPVDIAYGFPVSMTDFNAGRSTVMSPTTDLENLGDAAFSYQTGQGVTLVHTVIVLVGCVQLEVSGSATVDQLAALAKKIIAKL